MTTPASLLPSELRISLTSSRPKVEKAKNCLGIEPATQNRAHLNGVDPDPYAECLKPQSCHTCPVKSSQTKALEPPLVNGTGSCDRTHDASVNGLSEDSRASSDSFSSDPSESSKRSHCDNNGDDVTASSSSNVDRDDSSLAATSTSTAVGVDSDGVTYVVYESELQMPAIMRLIQKDLSEPYSIYTYRYFIHNWLHLCFMVIIVKRTFRWLQLSHLHNSSVHKLGGFLNTKSLQDKIVVDVIVKMMIFGE